MTKSRRRSLFAFGIVSLGMLSLASGGCHSSVPPVTMDRGGKVTVVIYKDGWPTVPRTITPRDKLFATLQRLLHAKSDWHTSMTDYAPNILVRGKKFEINLIPGKMVVNYSVSDTADAQLIRTLTARDYRVVAVAASALVSKNGVGTDPKHTKE